VEEVPVAKEETVEEGIAEEETAEPVAAVIVETGGKALVPLPLLNQPLEDRTETPTLVEPAA
jgi:hypothetical protein